RRPSSGIVHQIRAGHQSENRQGTRTDHFQPDAIACRRSDRMTGLRRHPAILLARSVAVASALTLAGAAVTAPTNTKPAESAEPTRPMRFISGTDSRSGCEPSCAQGIAAHGQITKDTPVRFRRVFEALGQKKLPIFISSPGGSVLAALAIGRDIRKRGLDV